MRGHEPWRAHRWPVARRYAGMGRGTVVRCLRDPGLAHPALLHLSGSRLREQGRGALSLAPRTHLMKIRRVSLTALALEVAENLPGAMPAARPARVGSEGGAPCVGLPARTSSRGAPRISHNFLQGAAPSHQCPRPNRDAPTPHPHPLLRYYHGARTHLAPEKDAPLSAS